MPQGHVYILASKRNGTLYIGVTNNLSARIHAHREGRGSAFTKKYNVKPWPARHRAEPMVCGEF